MPVAGPVDSNRLNAVMLTFLEEPATKVASASHRIRLRTSTLPFWRTGLQALRLTAVGALRHYMTASRRTGYNLNNEDSLSCQTPRLVNPARVGARRDCHQSLVTAYLLEAGVVTSEGDKVTPNCGNTQPCSIQRNDSRHILLSFLLSLFSRHLVTTTT